MILVRDNRWPQGPEESKRERKAVDKYEYKIRSEEIKTLIAKGEYIEAASIADTVDWRRVKSVMMLCTISDLYKMNRRLEDSRELLLLAYERHPGGRSIVYSLCEISIKMEEFVQAVEYYKDFVQIAPKDSGRYILQYKIYEAQDVGLEERISVLEELKARDYSEKWAYELAYLYHRVGLATRCVEECDELILWFGEGKYVTKAMELKMLHEPLSRQQQEKYNWAKGYGDAGTGDAGYEDTGYEEEEETWHEDMDIEVKPMGMGQYDTINIQKELAENMKDLWEGPPAEAITQSIVEPLLRPEPEPVSEEWDAPDANTPELSEEQEESKVEEVFFGETGEIDLTASQVMKQLKDENSGGETVRDTGIRELYAEAEEQTAIADSSHKNPAVGPNGQKFEKMLGMEYDGQISLLLPESEQIEKQITGQIKLDDILVEWEKIKKDSESKRREAVRQRMMEQTGAMFTEFEAAVRDGLLEKLESAKAAANGLALVQKPETAMESAGPDDLIDLTEAEETVLPEDEFIDEEAEMSMEEEAAGILMEDEEAEAYMEDEAAEEDLAEEALEEWQEEIPEETEREEYAEEEYVGEDIEDIEDTMETSSVIEENSIPEELPVNEKDGIEVDSLYEEEPVEESADEWQSEETQYDPADEGKVSPETEAAVSEQTEKSRSRTLGPEEKELFGGYIQTKNVREQIIHAIDSISLAAYTGNIILTGEEGMDTLTLAKNLIKQVQVTDNNFSGKIAKISASSLNKKDIAQTLEKLSNGALIIQKASGLKKASAESLYKALEQEVHGIVIILEDSPKPMNRFLKENAILS